MKAFMCDTLLLIFCARLDIFKTPSPYRIPMFIKAMWLDPVDVKFVTCVGNPFNSP